MSQNLTTHCCRCALLVGATRPCFHLINQWPKIVLYLLWCGKCGPTITTDFLPLLHHYSICRILNFPEDLPVTRQLWCLWWRYIHTDVHAAVKDNKYSLDILSSNCFVADTIISFNFINSDHIPSIILS